MGASLQTHSAEAQEAWNDPRWRPSAPLIEEARAREADIIPFDGPVRAEAIASAEGDVDDAFAAIDAAKHEQDQVTMNNRSDNNDL